MERIHINPRDAGSRRDAVSRALAELRGGKIVALATETIYGAFALASQRAATPRLRAARPSPGPLTIHLADAAAAAAHLTNPPVLASRIAKRVWPGPVAIVVSDSDAADEAIALRNPNAVLCREVAREAGPDVLLGTAAVNSDAFLAVDGDVVAAHGGDIVDLLIDEGPTALRSPSTVIEFQGAAWKITRTGPIDERLIRRWIDGLVLFVCTGNTCRSPMAEGMFRAAYERAVRTGRGAPRGVASTGTSGFPGSPISIGSLEELRKRGIDGSRHRAQSVTVELLQAADRIFTMTERHRRTVIELAPARAARVSLLDEARDIADPVGQDQEAYARCASQIESAVNRRVEELLDEDRRWE